MRRGEIVGLTGLLGMGHEQAPHLLFGSQRARDAASVNIGGARLRPAPHVAARCDRRRPRAAARQPAARGRGADRHRDRERDAHDAAVVLHPGRAPPPPGAPRGHDLLHEFHVTPPEPGRILAKLSGGNQQKALLAKWFATRPQVFLLHEPTQGVDIGAKKQIFAQIRDLAQAGGSVILASVEYADLAHLCDRVLVFRDGRVVIELYGAELTEERIVEQCFASDRSARIHAEPGSQT